MRYTNERDPCGPLFLWRTLYFTISILRCLLSGVVAVVVFDGGLAYGGGYGAGYGDVACKGDNACGQGYRCGQERAAGGCQREAYCAQYTEEFGCGLLYSIDYAHGFCCLMVK